MVKRKRKENIYHKEKDYLQRTQDFIASEAYQDTDATKTELTSIVENYEELLDQTVLITRISDRLQKKLDKTNDKLVSLNDQLNDKNDELQETIDNLLKAKVGRKATTYVFIFALVLFVFSEALIEPYIEAYYANNIYLSLGVKAVIAMSIKPLEMLVEDGLLKIARKQEMNRKEAEAKKEAAAEHIGE